MRENTAASRPGRERSSSVENAVNLPFDEGMAKERAIFSGLVVTNQSKAQRYVFFAERQAAKVADIPADTPTRKIAKVGVIGAGTMGGGISMNFLSAGIPVTIVETSKEALDRGVSIMRRNYENTAKKGRMTLAQVEERMGKLSPTLDFNALADADLVIEAAFEDMDLKKSIFERLDTIAKPGAILASNTSYLDVDAIAAKTKRPEDVLGMHFFSPANVMRLLEIVRGEKTSKSVLATITQLAPKIGKVPVVVGVAHGFVGNRMLAQRQREAQKLILEGATPSDVDRVLVDFGLPMGPFAMSDLAGLDIGWSAATSKRASIRDILCEEGRRGQKTGAGFYDYDEARNAKPSAKVEGIIRDFAKSKGIEQRKNWRRGNPRAAHLSDDQRGRENSRRGQGAARFRHRHRLDQRLRLAGLSRRPDVLRRHGRIEDGACQAQGVSGQVRRRLQAGGALGKPRGGGRDVYEVVTQAPSSGASRHLLPKGEGEPLAPLAHLFYRGRRRSAPLLPRGEGGAPKARRMRAAPPMDDR